MDQQANREEIIDLWGSVDRPGIKALQAWLTETDFFQAPSSTEFHLACPGGLAQHSLNVFHLLREKALRYLKTGFSHDSLVVAGLGHDLCKVDFYTRGTRNVKENGIWVAKQVWQVNDQFPMGHGEKSVSILQDFITLTEEEKLAIRWHMTAFDAGIHFNYPSGFAFRAASKKYPLVPLLFTADYEASQMLEGVEG